MKKSRSIKKGYFSPRELAMLYERYPHAIDTAALAKEMKRTVSAIHAAAARRGIRKTEHAIALIAKQYTGKGGQFTKGFTPWNKGMKGYQAGGRSVQTRFVAGQKPHTIQDNGRQLWSFAAMPKIWAEKIEEWNAI